MTEKTKTDALVDTPPISMPKPQDDPERLAQRQALGKLLVEVGNRMETDSEYRKQTQSMTR